MPFAVRYLPFAIRYFAICHFAICHLPFAVPSRFVPCAGDDPATCQRTGDEPAPCFCAGDDPTSSKRATTNASTLTTNGRQMRKMANANFEGRSASRHPRGHSRSPQWAESSRRPRRSRSPPQSHGHLPERGDRRQRDNNRLAKRSRSKVFQSGAGPCGGICAVCLGRHDHSFAKCEDTKLWDGSANAPRKSEGQLVAANGLPLCFDWQIPRGCGSISHPDQHRCLGCGKPNHGAQACPRAQKV